MNGHILVIGGGTMGAGIAFVAAHAGCDVVIVEPLLVMHDRIRSQVAKNAERAQDAGVPNRVRIAARFKQIGEPESIELVIEAVPERLDIKRSIFADVAALLAPNVLLATNTSSLSIAEIFESIAHPERTLGLHFFNPPPAMKLVEIVKSERTSEATIARAKQYAEKFGKAAVIVADTPGFIVNRVARPFYLEAMRALERGEADAEAIDTAARDAGFRMGPFELMDVIGLDVNLATTESVYQRTLAERLKPVEIQRQLVAQGNLGKKTGQGFYKYDAGGLRTVISFGTAPRSALRAPLLLDGFLTPTIHGSVRQSDVPQLNTDSQTSATNIINRMIASILREARMLVDEGAASVENVNIAMKLGVDYPESVRI